MVKEKGPEGPPEKPKLKVIKGGKPNDGDPSEEERLDRTAAEDRTIRSLTSYTPSEPIPKPEGKLHSLYPEIPKAKDYREFIVPLKYTSEVPLPDDQKINAAVYLLAKKQGLEEKIFLEAQYKDREGTTLAVIYIAQLTDPQSRRLKIKKKRFIYKVGNWRIKKTEPFPSPALKYVSDQHSISISLVSFDDKETVSNAVAHFDGRWDFYKPSKY